MSFGETSSKPRHVKLILAVCWRTQCCACGRTPTSSDRDESGESADQRNSDAVVDDWDDIQVEVTGNEFQWQYRCSGRARVFGTDDDRVALRNLDLPAHTKAEFMLKSGDYLYTNAIPEFDRKEISVPDMTFFIESDTADAGQFVFRGDQFCGYSHPLLSGQLVVESAAEFNRRLSTLDTHSRDYWDHGY